MPSALLPAALPLALADPVPTDVGVRVDTELIVVVTDAQGNTKTLDSNAPDPADRPTGIQFATQIQSGFYTASFALRRPIDRDNIDINLGDDVRIVLANGDTVYEGYVTALPRSMDDNGHTLSVSCAGWMTHAADEPFTEIFVDRDLSHWGDMSRARRVALLSSNYQEQGDWSVLPDQVSGLSCISQHFQRVAVTVTTGPFAIVETWYDAQGITIGSIYYDVEAGGVTPPSWNALLFAADTDTGSDEVTANLAGSTSAAYFTPSGTTRKFARVSTFLTNTATADGEWRVYWRKMAVYGHHGLPLIGTTDPKGVAASDVVKYLAGRYCPLLNTSGVQPTTYPISHLAFLDSTKPYDAFLKVNSYHLWQLAVWENRTLYFEPFDLTDWDWEIRHDDVGNQIGLQGDELTSLRNGIIVQYTNAATGTVETLRPENFAQLQDTGIDNPWTSHGRSVYGEPFVIPFPTTQADALQLGATQLAEDNQPKAPGSFTVHGWIKDRAGVYQPVSKVRAGDRIRITSSASLSDRPRLVNETQYSHDGSIVTIAIDTTLRYLEGYMDRVTTALAAANLSA